MRYQFKNFEFNSENLVLTKDGEAIEIRHNEAKVLALFLENTEKVLSKEEILSSVWQDKVVSDQAVFQNVSHLRSLFGNEAIKTFSKRGYQWQLDVEQRSNEDKIDTQLSHSSRDTAHSPNSLRASLQPFAWAATVLFAVLLVFGMLNKSEKEFSLRIAYIPFDNLDVPRAIKLDNTGNLVFNEIENVSTKRFLTSHQLEYLSLSEANKFVLAGRVRKFNHQYHLDFLLKGPYSDWIGQVSGTSQKELIDRLTDHLEQPSIYDFISKQQTPEIKQASLSIAHQEEPDDLIILNRLVESYIKTHEFDKAMLMADKLIDLANLQENVQYHGNGLLNQSEILTHKELFDLSAQKLAKSIEQFEKINDLQRYADALEKQSWIDHQKRDYPAIKASLLKSAELALEAKDIPRELHALTYLSVMAKKYRQSEDKYLYLQQAESKMREYQLPTYHYAKIPFHHAIYTSNPSGKEPHLKRVLEYTELNPDYWVAQSSRLQLLRHYISQGRFDEAERLVESTTSDNAPNSYLKTLLAKAQDKDKDFLRHAQRTFEQAHMSGNRRLSLDVALILCEHPNSPVNLDFYSQYIKENSTKYWRIENEKKLVALNL